MKVLKKEKKSINLWRNRRVLYTFKKLRKPSGRNRGNRKTPQGSTRSLYEFVYKLFSFFFFFFLRLEICGIGVLVSTVLVSLPVPYTFALLASYYTFDILFSRSFRISYSVSLPHQAKEKKNFC